MRKIDAMHDRYGFGNGTCKECENLCCVTYGDKARRAYKCTLYGISNAESTDWRMGWQACGQKDKPVPQDHVPIVRQLVHEKRKKQEETADKNQISMF